MRLMKKSKRRKPTQRVIGKELSPGLGLYVVGNPRKSGYPSVDEIKRNVLPRFQDKLVKVAQKAV